MVIVPGQLKALLDHFACRWMVHSPNTKMFNKQALIISTALGLGTKKVLKVCSKIKKREGKVTPRIKVKVSFYLVRFMNKCIRPESADKVYWREQGWIEKKRPW